MYRRRRRQVAENTAVLRAPLPSTYREILLQPYATPTQHDMAVVLVVFNPGSSVRIIQNLLLVKQKLETAGIPTYISELAFPNQSYIFPACDNIFQFKSDSYLFYKENLINLAEIRIPPQFSKICTLDADIIFAQPDWYDKISAQLDTHDLCQVFQSANWLDITFSSIIQNQASVLTGGHPGFGWAVQRSFFRTCGFPEFAVVGGGDVVLSGRSISVYAQETAAYRRPTLKSAFAPGLTVYHLSHGQLQTRQYASRHAMMAAYLLSIGKSAVSDILYKRDDGLLEFLPEFRQSANALMIAYFNARSDDAI
jgi:hypothetical protein